jgi:hypothetical protein
MTEADAWPFDQPRDCAVITLKSIVFRGAAVLVVCHDEEDGGWQFLDGGALEVSEGAVVGLGEMVERDPTLLEVADLPLGWRAWRKSVGGPWRRARKG